MNCYYVTPQWDELLRKLNVIYLIKL